MRVKLVRDRCGAVLDGECAQATSDSEYQLGLLLKLHEEAQEIAGAPGDPEEYADVIEVLIALMQHNGVGGREVLQALEAKRRAAGGFEDGQIWTEEFHPREGIFEAEEPRASVQDWIGTLLREPGDDV